MRGSMLGLLLLLGASGVASAIDPKAMSLDVYFYFAGEGSTTSPENQAGCPTLRCREIVELEFRGFEKTCGGEEQQCEWPVLDLIFSVSKDPEGENVVELTGIEDVSEEEQNAILEAASDTSDTLLELSKLADGSGYTVNCRDAFLNGTACTMSKVEQAERRFLRSDIFFVCVSGLCTLTFLTNFSNNNFLTKQGQAVLDTKQNAILGVSLVANLGIAVAKLFWWDAYYSCSTRMCQKMVHNGVMSVTECIFDFALLWVTSKVGVVMTKFDPCCQPCASCNAAGHLLNHLQRVIGPIVTVAWLLWDTFQARLYAPGNDSLAIVAVACVLQVLVFLSGLYMFYAAFFRALCCPSDAEPAASVDAKPEGGQGAAVVSGGVAISMSPSAGQPLPAPSGNWPAEMEVNVQSPSTPSEMALGGGVPSAV